MNKDTLNRKLDPSRLSAPIGLQPPWAYADVPALVELRASNPAASSREINRAAGLDWLVYQTPMFMFVPTNAGDQPRLDRDGFVTAVADGRFALVATPRDPASELVPAYVLNVRADHQRVLGIVRKRYRIMQNEQAPAFLDSVIRAGEASYASAGALHGGAQVWWLLKLAGSVSVARDRREELATYVLLTNSHDGSTSLNAAILGLRQSSQCTLVWRLPGVRRVLKVRHTESAREQSLEAQRVLELAHAYQQRIAEVGEQMLHTPLADKQLEAFLDKLLPTPKPRIENGRITNQRGITMADNAKGAISGLYFNNETPGSTSTTRHSRTSRERSGVPCRRVSSTATI